MSRIVGCSGTDISLYIEADIVAYGCFCVCFSLCRPVLTVIYSGVPISHLSIEAYSMCEQYLPLASSILLGLVNVEAPVLANSCLWHILGL